MSRQGGSGEERGAPGAADRVRRSHAQTRVTVRLALAFLLAAAIAAAVGASRWIPLHLFLAGAVVLAISGVSLMLTVTWSAAPAPADRWVAVQRWLVAAGAAGVVIAREAELASGVTAIAGVAYVAGLLLLAVLLAVTARRGTVRRYDPAVASYLAALVAGVVGVGVGVSMAVDGPTWSLRSAHVVVNLLGLVGLVIGGTMPFFAATVGRSRMAPHATRARLAVHLGWQVAMVVIAAVALASSSRSWAAAGLGGYAAGVVAVLALLPRPTSRQLRWSGPRLVGLWLGGAWWAVAVAATAVDAAAGRAVLDGRWLGVLVVAGYAQILWGSLAYLLPMLRGGGHERLSEGFATTRSWVGPVAASVAAMAMIVEWPAVAGIAIAVWVLDGGWRAVRVGTGRAPRPNAAS